MSDAIALHCLKCGTDLWIRPVSDADREMLRQLSLVDDAGAWRDGMGCPVCAQNRGGHYPLQRYPQPGEPEAIAAHAAAAVALHLATEPDGPPPVGCSESEQSAFDASVDAYMALEDAERDATEALTALGFSSSECWDLRERAIAAHQRAARAAGAEA